MLAVTRTQCTRCKTAYRSWIYKSSIPRYRWNSDSTGNDLFVPTTFSRLEVSDQAPIISGYTTRGFMISGNTVYGSVALLPRGMMNWKVTNMAELVMESFALFYIVQPKIDLVVVGTGSRVQRVDPVVIQNLKKKGINLEIQDTPNACATFNFLLSEGRPAGAALIPPEHIPP